MRTQTQTLLRSPVVSLVLVALASCSSPPSDTARAVSPAVWCPPRSVNATNAVDAGPTDDCGPVERFDAGTTLPDSGSDAGTDGGSDGGTGTPDSGTLLTMRLDVAGLWTNPNPIGQQRPAGALDVADDIVIDSPGTASVRRADDPVGVQDVDPGVLSQGWDYGDYMFAWGANSGGLVRGVDLGTGYIDWDSVATVSTASPNLRLPYAAAGGDLYLLSNVGPLVMDGGLSAPAVPGAPASFDPPSIVTTASASGWLNNNESTAYKIVFGFNDSDGKPVLGEPSGRYVVTAASSGGPFRTVVQVQAPPGVTDTSGHFVQVYRTPSAPTAATLGDSYYLVYETPWVPTFPSGSTMLITDIAFAGELPLYTNPDRGGVRSNNVRPPLAEDVAPFRNRLWLANTTAPSHLRLRIIAPPSGGSETVTIAGGLYTLATSAGTVSQQIEYTARDLIGQLSLSNTNVRATYASGTTDPPGLIDIVGFDIGYTFTAVAGNATTGGRFVPNITTAVSGVADEYPNRLHYSKDGLPYAFPLPNTLPVGAQEHGISRIVPLRDALLVFKERGGDGLWKVTGNGTQWYVEQVNSGVQLISPDALTVVDNTIFALTEDGIVAVTETGVEDVDVPIEDQINTLMLERADAVPYAKVFGREALGERKVYFGFPSASVAGDGTDFMVDTFVYNLNTQTWTKDRRLWQGAYVNSAGRMVRFTEQDIDLQLTYLERISGNALADRLGVEYSIAWNVETAENPGAEKQFYQVAVLTKEAQPASTDTFMYFTADDGEQSVAVETGGDGSNYIRAEVPWDRQRTSRLAVEMRGTVVNPINIVGITATYRQYGGTLKGR